MSKQNKNSSKAPSQRQLRAGELIRKEIASVLSTGFFDEPELSGISITVSEVRMSPDLRHATAFIMPLGGQHAEEMVDVLQGHAKEVQRQIGRVIKMKFTPKIRFEIDRSYEYADRISMLLKSTQENDIES